MLGHICGVTADVYIYSGGVHVGLCVGDANIIDIYNRGGSYQSKTWGSLTRFGQIIKVTDIKQ